MTNINDPKDVLAALHSVVTEFAKLRRLPSKSNGTLQGPSKEVSSQVGAVSAWCRLNTSLDPKPLSEFWFLWKILDGAQSVPDDWNCLEDHPIRQLSHSLRSVIDEDLKHWRTDA
jgi:hypothetical protein